jgi:endonuclease IV
VTHGGKLKKTDLRLGLKLWSSNVDLISGAQKLIETDVFDYVELTPVPGRDIKPFVDSSLPFVIHVTHERFGFNIADPAKKDFNTKVLDDCIDFADRLDAKYLVLHPGFGAISDSLDFLSSVDDERILVENMPHVGMNGEPMVGCLPEDVERLLDGRFGLCLDFGHAIKAAHSVGLDYKVMLSDFMKLSPQLFHLHDGNSKKGEDEHLSLGEGDFDVAYLFDRLRKLAAPQVTLETPRNAGLDEDIKNAKYVKDLIRPSRR